MKFKFCSDGDCPLWALAGLHAISTLPAPLFRKLVECVVDGQNDDAIKDILKDTSLSSRDENARAAAVIRWTLRQAWSCQCPGSQLSRDLLMLGVPRTHAGALAEAADSGRQDYERRVEENPKLGFFINKVTDAAVSEGPEGSINTIKLSLYSEDMSGEETKREFLMDKNLGKNLLEDLKTAYKLMETYEKEMGKQE